MVEKRVEELLRRSAAAGLCLTDAPAASGKIRGGNKMTTKQCHILFGCMFLTYLPAQALLVLFWASAFGSPGPTTVFGQAVMLAWMLGALRYHGLSWRSLLPEEKDRFARGKGSVLAVVCGLLLMTANLCVQSLFTPMASGEGNVVGGLLGQGGWQYLLQAILLPAVVEELVFRGGFYQALRREQKAWVAALVSSLHFVAMHFSLPHLLSGTVLGLCSAALLEGAGPLLPTMLLLSLPLAQKLSPALGALLKLPALARGGLALLLGGTALILCAGWGRSASDRE